MKKYQRASGNELDTFLIRNNKVQKQPELFNEIFDINGNPVNPKGLKRANEMTGAGIEYATSLVEYVCTHHKDLIKKTDSALYYETVPIEWEAALEIMTGGLREQRPRAAKELLRLHAKPRPVLIKRKNGNLISMQPFVLAFDWGRPETLDARAAANLARMQKGAEELAKKREVEAAKKENRPVDVENIEYPDLLPIENISVQFSKPLFEDLMIKGGNTYSFPMGMYAKMFDISNRFKKELSKEMTLENRAASLGLSNIDTDVYISAYARFARYIIRHNNLTAANMKDKNYRGRITLPVYDFLESVYPSLIHIDGRRGKSIERQKFHFFMGNAQSTCVAIPGFKIYPVWLGIKNEKLVFALYTVQEEAVKAMKEVK